MENKKPLSKAEMKKILGAQGNSNQNEDGCLVIGSPCRYNYECCPNVCAYFGGEYGICYPA